MDEKWKDYFYKGLAAFVTVAMCILFYFIMLRFGEISGYIQSIQKILRPFIYGGVIAYLLVPICNWLEIHMKESSNFEKKSEQSQKKCQKWISGVSILLSLLIFCFIIYAVIAMIVPQLISSVLSLIEALPQYMENTSLWLENLVADNPVMLNYVEQYSADIIDGVQDFAKTYVIPNINSIISGVSMSLWTVVSWAMDAIVGVIVAIYLMSSRKMFKHQAKKLIYAIFHNPPKNPEKESIADWIIREIGILNMYFGGFIKGKLLDSFIICLICIVFTSLMNMPYAMLVSIVVGVTNIIPFFGPFIGAIPSAILILLADPMKCVYFVIFIIILQQFDGNILGPKILGNTTNLNSFWVLFAILLFGGIFGIVGMIIGVPLFAFFYQLVKEWVNKRLDTNHEI